MTQMGGVEYFVKKFCEPILQVLHYVAATGGFVTACQWMFWLLCIIKRTLSAFCKPPMPVPTDNKLRADVLLELLGDTRPEPYRQTSAAHRRGLPNVGVRFTSKEDGDGSCEIVEPMQRA